MLQQAGSGWENDIGRGGAEHDQVDLAGLHPGRIQRVGGGIQRQIAGGLASGSDMALADTGAVTNPLVAGLHHRSEEHTSELQSLMRSSYAVFCLKKKINKELRNRTIQKTSNTKTRKSIPK